MSGPSTVTCPCCGSAKVHNGWEGTPVDWHTCDCGAGWYESRRAPAAGDALERANEERVRLHNELLAVRRDAERYRWLRDCDTDFAPDLVRAYSGEMLDAQIDAAMTAHHGGGGDE